MTLAFADTLFDSPPTSAVPDDKWLVWSPECNVWFIGFPADLAARYFIQGAAVRLHDTEDEGLSPPPGNPPEADPYAPPYSELDIVWHYRAAEFAPESYADGWERISTWVREFYPHARPEDVADILSRRVGRWGGGYDLEAAGMDSRTGYGIDGKIGGGGWAHVAPCPALAPARPATG